jgi:hypothetical protein
MMAALQRRFPLGGIILGDVHRLEGPVVGFRWRVEVSVRMACVATMVVISDGVIAAGSC